MDMHCISEKVFCEFRDFLNVIYDVGEITISGLRFEWKIRDFLKKLEWSCRDYIDSPSFRYEGTDWYLTIGVLDINNPSPLKDICLYVCREQDGYPESVKVSLGFCRSSGIEGKASNGTAEFAKHQFYWGPFKFHADLEKMLEPEGALTVYCYLKKDRDEEDDSDSEDSSDEDEELRDIKAECCVSLYEDMKKLYEDQIDCDVELVVGEMRFSAHSAVLSCRSAVFYGMLKTHPGYLVLQDCEPHIFSTFLEYLYLGRIEDPSPTNAFKLYRQAYLYDISPLKKHCLCVLYLYLRINNVCEVVYYSKKYCVTDIFERALKLLVLHRWYVLNSTEWIKYLKLDPVLMNEIMKQLISSVKKSRNIRK